MILGYKPLSRVFQDIGQSIRAGSSRLARIDISKPGFLAQRDLPPVTLPVPQNLPPAAQPPPQDHLKATAFIEEEVDSSRLLLKEEIDEFYFEENNPKTPLINLLDAEGESDRNSGICAPLLVIACSDNSSDKEEDIMALNKVDKSLRELMAARGKGSTSKAPTKSQAPSNLPPAPPQVPADLGLNANPDLKKKRPAKSLEEGEVGPRHGTKHQKVIQEPWDKRAQSVDSREEKDRAEVRVTQPTWSPRLEVDGHQFLGMPLSENTRGVEQDTLLKPWSSPCFFLGTWTLTGVSHKMNFSCP